MKKIIKVQYHPIARGQMNQTLVQVDSIILLPIVNLSNRVVKHLQDQDFPKTVRKVLILQLRKEKRMWVGGNHQAVLKRESKAVRVVATRKMLSHQKIMQRNLSHYLTSSTNINRNTWTNLERSCRDQQTAQWVHFVNQIRLVDHRLWLSISNLPLVGRKCLSQRQTCSTKCLLIDQEVHFQVIVLCSQTGILQERKRLKNKWTLLRNPGTT